MTTAGTHWELRRVGGGLHGRDETLACYRWAWTARASAWFMGMPHIAVVEEFEPVPDEPHLGLVIMEVRNR